MNKIFLKNEQITGCTLTSDGTLAYIALRILINESIPLYNQTSSIDCISINRLAYSLTKLTTNENALTDSLIRGIVELNEEKLIQISKDLSTAKSYEYILDLKNIWLDTEQDNFTTIDYDDINKIMTCNERMDKRIKMLKYYAALLSTFDWSFKGKIGHMSQDYIAKQADTSTKTCQRYNKILVDMELLYIYKSNDKIAVDDKLKQIKNCYSRYEDRDICMHYASDYEENFGIEHTVIRTRKNKEQADNNRRLAQIYNRICEGNGDSYDEATIIDVHRYITNRNKTLQDEIDAKKRQDYLSSSDKAWIEKLESQIRDTSIFEQFDFLKPSANECKEIWGEWIDLNELDIFGETDTIGLK